MTLRRTFVTVSLVLALAGAARADLHDTPNGRGALAGKTVVVSPGHGTYDQGGGYSYQRDPTPTSFADDDRVREDIHTNEIVIEYLQRYLSNAGAVVFSCRERSFQVHERIVDDGGIGYSETGAFFGSTSAPEFHGTGYRAAQVSTAETAVARFTVGLPEAGEYPVYVWYTPSANRSRDALYRVRHAGGTTEVRVDQTLYRAVWFYLGTFFFDPARGQAVVELSNQGSDPSRYVIADAIRVGGGLGASGEPRWKEAAKAYLPYAGYPDPGDNDVVIRPRFANWLAGGAAGAWRDDFRFISVHTNAGSGSNRGTMTISYSNGRTPSWAGYGTGPAHYPASPSSLESASDAFRDRTHAETMRDLRAAYGTWPDLGLILLNLGELREALVMPSTLTELAFHDSPADVAYLRDARFRHVAARALYKSVVRSFDPAATIVPLAPAEVRAENAGGGRVRVSWRAVGDALEPSAAPSGFKVYRSPDGRAFDGGTAVAGAGATEILLGLFAAGETVYVRVAATNAGGESLPSKVAGARVAGSGVPEVLVVDGFTRPFRHSYKNIEARYRDDHLAAHGDAIARATALAFDGAAADAVAAGRVALAGYPMIDWFVGQESTEHETLSDGEQTIVASYLAGGGSLLLSGSEVGWDLEWRGGATDRTFYRDWLRAGYVQDDAGTRAVGPVAGSSLALVPPIDLHDGTRGAYEVRFPDVIAPGGRAAPALAYGNGAGTAAIEVDDGFKLIYLGFPLEGVADPAARGSLFRASADMLLAGIGGGGPPPGPGPAPAPGPGRTGGGGGGGGGCSAAPGAGLETGAGWALPLLLLFLGSRSRCRRARRGAGQGLRRPGRA